MRCPKCGTENPPAGKFCSQCGAPLPAESAAKPKRSRGWRLSSIVQVVIAAIVFIGILINVVHPFGLKLTFKDGLSRDEPTPTVSPKPVTPTVTQTTSPAPLSDEELARQETMAALKKAADVLSAGDKATFLNALSADTRLKVRDDLNLSSPEAKLLSQGLSTAKAVEVHAGIVFYEMTVNSESYSFYVSKEANEWKIGGL